MLATKKHLPFSKCLLADDLPTNYFLFLQHFLQIKFQPFMRQAFLSIITILLFVGSLSAQQQHWCGTTPTSPAMSSMVNRLMTNKQFAEEGMVTSRDVIYIPIKYHLVAKDDGTGRINIHSVLDNLCELNEDFAPYEMQFYLAGGTFNLVDNTRLYERHTEVENSVMNAIRDTRAINVFVVESANIINDPEEQGTTLAYYNIPRDWIVITNSYVRGNEATLTHEIGHYFSLLHPFNGYDFEPYDTEGENAPFWSPISNIRTERADGSNCESAGDFICDTPAEYNNGLGNSTCRFTRNILDPVGDQIDPDELNYVSYFLRCSDNDYYFSDQQHEIMLADYNSTSRRPLRLATMPPVQDLGAMPAVISPVGSSTTQYFDAIDFEWSATPGATGYLLEVSRLPNFQILTTRYLVNGTSYRVDNLDAEKEYYWRVRPYNAHNGCRPGAYNLSSFTTSNVAEGTVRVETPDFVEAFRVAPNPVIGTDDVVIFLQSSEQFTGHLRLIDVAGRTVSEQLGQQFTAGEHWHSFPTASLASGVYWLELLTDVGRVTQKVVIAR